MPGHECPGGVSATDHACPGGMYAQEAMPGGVCAWGMCMPWGGACVPWACMPNGACMPGGVRAQGGMCGMHPHFREQND